ncbi:pseudouridine synthase [Neoconidiobolus thromboides FSU 785]|nr:pseudouridine synthase [Neoconidiobolus thromboides FSU 785]
MIMKQYNNKRLLNGVIGVNKPSGISSFDVIKYMQNILYHYYNDLDYNLISLPTELGKYKGNSKLPYRRVGHGGTLDPLAEGVMVIATGDSTKLLNNYLNGSKEYIVQAKLGITTDTMDSTGKIIDRKDELNIEKEQILNLLSKFVGTYEQKPPLFSAIRVNGKRLYALARDETRNEIIDIKSRLVTYSTTIELKVNCEKGFYIRSLINDLGDLLGSGAHVTKLIRIQQGSFKLNQCHNLNEIENILKAIQSNKNS